ncbi:sensor histidine kinase [Kutzneria buriramensis]|uniref:histidine kinase n=1 Tax=Kutzneria buriramensis TaxID=1045776 RepID=A0A3E0H214_9PSEU|nr:histidine kinase [Kutzneria buriramensis]REH35798.1 signal transduction histidine kinase [Kutzneria buriramensis]
MTRPRWRDAFFLLSPFATVLGVMMVIWAVYGPPETFHEWTQTFIQLPSAVALLWHRKAPLLLLALCAASAIAMTVSAYTDPQLFVGDLNTNPQWVPLATPFAVGVAFKRIPGSCRMWACTALLIVISTRCWAPSFDAVTGGAFFTLFPALFGLYIGNRASLIRALTDRAERAEREQELLAEQARADERVRLAGEMHDVVTHRVSLMVLQAGALRITAPDDATRTAAEELREAGCQALDELRDLVGVLRAQSGADEEEQTDAVRLPDLAELVAESRGVGMSVELIVDGNPLLTAPVVGRTAYRVVQEALTNVRKHAPDARTRVHVRYGADRVRLTVRNGPSQRTGELGDSGSGTGLLGLRQRVELVSGRFTAAARPDGGFEVDAILPAFVPTTES